MHTRAVTAVTIMNVARSKRLRELVLVDASVLLEYFINRQCHGRIIRPIPQRLWQSGHGVTARHLRSEEHLTETITKGQAFKRGTCTCQAILVRRSCLHVFMCHFIFSIWRMVSVEYTLSVKCIRL